MGNMCDEGPFVWQTSNAKESLSLPEVLPAGHLLEGLQAALMLQAEVISMSFTAW